jgi:hypothetical protein
VIAFGQGLVGLSADVLLDRYRPCLAFQDRGDLVVLQIQKPAHDDHFSLFGRHGRPGAAQERGLLPALRLPIGRHAGAANVPAALGHGDLGFVADRMIHVNVAPHLKHPGARPRSRLVRMPVLQNTEEDFLHHVLADGAVGGEVQKEAK